MIFSDKTRIINLFGLKFQTGSMCLTSFKKALMKNFVLYIGAVACKTALKQLSRLIGNQKPRRDFPKKNGLSLGNPRGLTGNSILYIYTVLSAFAGPVSARWATEKDASVRYDLSRSLVTVKKNGAYTVDREFKIKLIKESALGRFGNFLLTYNGKAQSIEILSAKTLVKGKEFPVNLNLIEDKPLATPYKGFDQIRQVRVAFPRLQVGADISLRYRHHFHTVAFPGFFSYFDSFRGDFLNHREIKVESALPLFYKVHNPGRILSASYRILKNKKKYVLHIRLHHPVFKAVINEKSPFTDPDLYAWVEIATSKQWGKMAAHLTPLYEKIITSPLPKPHQNILDSARKIHTGPEDQIEFIIASLIEKIRYFRDWQAINGGHVPRPLAVIAKTGFGDCKDMSVSLSAILRKLNFKAEVGFIHRQYRRHGNSDFNLPNGGAFNHAVVRAEIGGKVFWLDPTNRVSYARGLFKDIADRPILVLKESGAELLRTPKLPKKKEEYRITRNFEITDQGEIKVTGAVNFIGRGAVPWTAASLYKSKESLDYSFIQFIGTETSELKKWKVEGYDLSSRIVRDLSAQISYSMSPNSHPFNFSTQLGPVFTFPRWGRVYAFDIRVRGRESDLFLGSPYRAVLISKLKNIKPLKNAEMNCSFKSPWADFQRRVESLNPLTVKDVFDFKAMSIPIKDLRSRRFLRLQKDIKTCFQNFLMVYKKTG